MPPRLRGWDYRAPATYFVTCVAARRPLLGCVDGERIRLSAIGGLVARQIELEFSASSTPIPYVVMPDHIHLLIARGGPTTKPDSLATVVARLKGNVTRQARACALIATHDPLWQRGFFDRIVRDDREYEALLEYIATNPLRWRLRYGRVDGSALRGDR